MFQKEVAWRVAQGPGTKDYGILSVLCQAFYEVKYLFTVDEHVFNPPPKVKSGVLSMIKLEKDLLDGLAQEDFFRIVKTAFNQRRKTLRNSLSSLNIPEGSKHLPIFGRRPEQLHVREFVELTKIIKGA
jgi:16S rRNA (adenine1518-N6/adenine1519-N6)-dimethyltransferase